MVGAFLKFRSGLATAQPRNRATAQPRNRATAQPRNRVERQRRHFPVFTPFHLSFHPAIAVANANDSDATLAGQPSGKTLKVYVIAANDAGQTAPSDTVKIVVP
jgi:hypothetical protein